jgi:hypothetical protein
MPLGLGSNLIKTGMPVVSHVTSNLKMLHRYNTGSVVPVSDGAAYFGGGSTEDRITITETAFNVDGAAYTFAFWAKRMALDTNHTILGHTDTASYKRIILNSGNDLVVESDTDDDAIVVTPNVEDLEWHHYAVTITGSGSTAVAYQDGAVCADSGDVASNNMTINMIGASNTGGADNEFHGYLCNIGIWEAVLTQPQVKSIMFKSYSDLTTGSGSESENLIHWWALDEGTGTSATDSKGGNTGTFAS